jgi:hypothetical protein
MKTDRRVDFTVLCAFALMAGLAMITTVITISPSLRLFATIGGIVLGPGILAYRIAVRSGWIECLAAGIGINVAFLMSLGMLGIATNYWHPRQLEFLLPLTTLLLVAILFRGVILNHSPDRTRTSVFGSGQQGG